MTDTPMAAKPKPTAILKPSLSPEAERELQAIRDLTADFNPYNGIKKWWYQDYYTIPITKNKNTDGISIITYTLEASRPYNDVSAFALETHSLDHRQKQILRDVLSSIERAANIKFVEIEHVDKRDAADIRYFQGRMRKSSYEGLTKNHSIIRDVVITDHAKSINYKFDYNNEYDTILHETLHALGMSHPGGNGESVGNVLIENANGFNKRYNKNETAMSYNPGTVKSGLGRYDVATLQYLFGSSQTQERPEKIITPPATGMLPPKPLKGTGIR